MSKPPTGGEQGPVRDREPYPRGHFYSPLPDVDDVRARSPALFRRDVDEVPGVDLRESSQRALLAELAAFYPEFDWPPDPSPRLRYHTGNKMFGAGSGFTLYAMLRRFSPERVIEIGSGFSSALMLDTSERFCRDAIELTFVEPNDERLLSVLRSDDRSRCRVVREIVQATDVREFRTLAENDFLFVDSSHVAKAGSDVNFIFAQVLPALRPGVIVHFHDIYWSFEYPESWIVERRRAWNEAYVLRAFLQYNERFEILQFNDYLAYRFRDFYERRLPTLADAAGSSFWMRKR